MNDPWVIEAIELWIARSEARRRTLFSSPERTELDGELRALRVVRIMLLSSPHEETQP